MSSPVDSDAKQPELVPLAEPRRLVPTEHVLLKALVEPLGLPELSEQVAHAEVVARCSCGCPSVGLRTTGPELAAEVVRRLDTVGRDDVCAVTAWGVNRHGREVEVTLHVVFGHLEELEIWAGWDGGEVETELPGAESLRRERRG